MLDAISERGQYLVLSRQYQGTNLMPKNVKSSKKVAPKTSRRKSSGSAREASQRDRLLSKLPDLGEILRGTLVTRYRRCGRPNCHCAREGDPGHGPAYYLMVTVAPGKTIQVYVPEDDRRVVEDWINNFRRARETLEKISTVNRNLLKQGKLFKGG